MLSIIFFCLFLVRSYVINFISSLQGCSVVVFLERRLSERHCHLMSCPGQQKGWAIALEAVAHHSKNAVVAKYLFLVIWGEKLNPPLQGKGGQEAEMPNIINAITVLITVLKVLCNIQVKTLNSWYFWKVFAKLRWSTVVEIESFHRWYTYWYGCSFEVR